jgi:S1-C subfamily serine protease
MPKLSLTQVVAALVGGLVVVAVLVIFGATGGGTTTTVIDQLPAVGSATSNGGGGLSAPAIYARDAPGVVYVTARVVSQEQTLNPFDLNATPQTTVSTQTGSGIVISADGTILTNAHVIDGAVKITVGFANGTTVAARVIGKDPDDDLALLSVNPSGMVLDPLPLGNSNTVAIGDPTVAIGNPYNLVRTLTTGVVSALQREIQAPNGFTVDDVIQTDAPINPGNSGGPLINAEGQVIGINSQIETGGSGGGSVGIGFAIPINTAKFVIPQLERDGHVSEGYLGLETADIGPADAGLGLDASSGALVEAVEAGTPAARAGLHGGTQTKTLLDGSQLTVGGDIIVSAAGQAIHSSDELEQVIESKQPGTRIAVGVIRDGRRLTLEVTLGTRPESLPASG